MLSDEDWEKMLDTPVWDYVMMSSSAPTFFPSYRKHVDGGVVSNNASLTAAITVRAHFHLFAVNTLYNVNCNVTKVLLQKV